MSQDAALVAEILTPSELNYVYDELLSSRESFMDPRQEPVDGILFEACDTNGYSNEEGKVTFNDETFTLVEEPNVTPNDETSVFGEGNNGTFVLKENSNNGTFVALREELNTPNLDMTNGPVGIFTFETEDTKQKHNLNESALNRKMSIMGFEAYSGRLNFQMFLQNDFSQSSRKWIYSTALNKVFIDIDKVLAVHFRWNCFDPNVNLPLFVRALPVYTTENSPYCPVVRCPVHILPDNPLNIGFPFVDHVLRCEHSETRYITNPVSEQRSCITPLDMPQAGTDTVTLTYKFVCKTSCPSGMDRRPIVVVFTLEDVRGLILGRQFLAVKICSCPKRDKEKEEKHALEQSRPVDENNTKTNNKSKPPKTNAPTPRKQMHITDPDGEGFRDITITGLTKQMYHYLLTTLYDSLKGRTVRLQLDDTEDVLQQLQTQIMVVEGDDIPRSG